MLDRILNNDQVVLDFKAPSSSSLVFLLYCKWGVTDRTELKRIRKAKGAYVRVCVCVWLVFFKRFSGEERGHTTREASLKGMIKSTHESAQPPAAI